VDAIPFEALGITGFVAAAIYSIYRGSWTPARTVTELTKMRDERIKELAAERDDWKHTALANMEIMREQGTQVEELLELAKTGNALMRALNDIAGKGSV
jgi:uncharacterized protein YjiS (DUF1127 family)